MNTVHPQCGNSLVVSMEFMPHMRLHPATQADAAFQEQQRLATEQQAASKRCAELEAHLAALSGPNSSAARVQVLEGQLQQVQQQVRGRAWLKGIHSGMHKVTVRTTLGSW